MTEEDDLRFVDFDASSNNVVEVGQTMTLWRLLRRIQVVMSSVMVLGCRLWHIVDVQKWRKD